LLEKLHAHYPDAPLHIVVRKGNEALLAGHPFLQKVWTWDKKSAKTLGLLRLGLALRQEGFTHVVNPHRFASSGVLAWMTGAPHRVGFSKNPLAFTYTRRLAHIISPAGTAQPVHEVERNQTLIAAFTDDAPALPRLYPTALDYAAVAPLQDAPYVCIAPASVWPTKQFPAERWTVLARKLSATHQVYLVGGPGDKALAAGIAATAGLHETANLCGKLSFLQSAALMQGAAMNYTNDSAPLHTATAMRAPLIAVFCSTVPRFGFGPLVEGAHAVEHPGPLYCRPCGLHGRRACPEGHFKCALDIREEDLLWWT